MKHQHIDKIDADIVPYRVDAMTRAERLERWAQLVAKHQGPLLPLHQIEFLDTERRLASRHDSSPIAVAYGDPVLRAEGLKGDTVGDASEFFSLSDAEAHHLLCDCHHYGGMTTDRIASQLHRLAAAS